ncbi:hypothetical protein LEP1GSC037_3324, partial [Leptospira interrogans str. 2006001854]
MVNPSYAFDCAHVIRVLTSKYPGCSVSISPSTCFSNLLFS